MTAPSDALRNSEASRGMRDLMSLLALSALWLDKDAATIIRLMCESVERLTAVRFCFVGVSTRSDPVPMRLVFVSGQQVRGAALDDWIAASLAWPKSAAGASLHPWTDTPLGSQRIVKLELGVHAVEGGVWFGSDLPDFPSLAQLSVLRAAGSLAATALQAAHVREEREEAYRSKDQFLAMLGHELRNPLAPIRAGARILQLPGVSAVQVRKTGEIMERQVAHLTNLVDDLLDVSRLSVGAIELDNATCLMQDVLGSAVEQAMQAMETGRHTLELQIAPAPACVLGDRERLLQVVSNLLANAAKYTPPGGHIVLSLDVTAAEVRIAVSDNGIGIDRMMVPRVFELFTQVKRNSGRAEGGLGLGLALVKMLVELHKGRVSVSSGGLGCGARFEIVLPRLAADGEAVIALAPAASAVPPHALRIVVVDDNEDAGQMLGDLLEAFGHQVTVYSRPHEALRNAAASDTEVFLLDIGMPGMDGYQLATRLKAEPAIGNARLVALTGYGQENDQKKALQAGFDFHLVKPVNIDLLNQLLLAISAALQGK